MAAIPERAPIADCVTAYVLQDEYGQTLLADQPIAAYPTVTAGLLIVRYGLRLLGRLSVSIVPGLVVLDYGTMLTGEAAWEFLLEKSNRFPRAEVFGYLNDGADEMLTVKRLDLSIPPEVLIYANVAATQPLAKPTKRLLSGPPHWPERLLAYLPTG